jgi:hypothetical protein
VLIRTAEKAYADVTALDHTYDVNPDEVGPGAEVAYRGDQGWVCFQEARGRLVLVNTRHVILVGEEGDGARIETSRGTQIDVVGPVEQAVAILNQARRRADRAA